MADNICGECRACCTVLGVKELDKPVYTACSHECSGGCSIYKDRPDECRTYKCLFYLNPFDKRFRPDKIGVIVEPSSTKFGATLVVREVIQGASDSKEAQEYINNLLAQTDSVAYIVRPDNTRSAIFPPGKEHLINLFPKRQ
jgi:hypothetical protein